MASQVKVVIMAVLIILLTCTMVHSAAKGGDAKYKVGDLVEVKTDQGQWLNGTIDKVWKTDDGSVMYDVTVPMRFRVTAEESKSLIRTKTAVK